jgi:outer membrane protein assembly factor BamB
MSRSIVISVGLFFALLSAQTVGADRGDSALISQIEAQRYGLERAWFTQVQLDPARARMTDMIYFVSATQSHTVYEVQYQERKRAFSERDTDRFGDLMGKEKAEKEANAFMEELKLSEIESKLATIQVPETTLYAVTDRAVVHAIDAETGRTRWSTVVGNRDYPVERPGISEDYVAVLNGSTLHLLKRQTGEMAWIRTIQGVASAGPALTAEYVIVPTFTGDVELYDIKETRTLPEIYRSNGRVLIQPLVTPMSVLWPTDRGLLYSAQNDQKGLRYRMEAKQPIVSQAAYASPNKVLAASIDGYVYCLHELSGDELWRFSAGEAISNSPVPIRDAVYVVTDKGSLFALNLETGLEKWSAPQVKRLLSVSKDRLYCLTMTGRLSILDAKTGARIALMATNQLDVFYSNTLTDRILVGTTTGVVQCLHEIELQWPLVHVNLAEAEQKRRPEIKQEGLDAKTKPAAKPGAPGAAEPKPAAGGEDPFGEGGAKPAAGGAKPVMDGADPFGGGAAPKPAADPADPFGEGGAKPAAGGADPFGGGAAPKPAAGGAAPPAEAGAAKEDPF